MLKPLQLLVLAILALPCVSKEYRKVSGQKTATYYRDDLVTEDVARGNCDKDPSCNSFYCDILVDPHPYKSFYYSRDTSATMPCPGCETLIVVQSVGPPPSNSNEDNGSDTACGGGCIFLIVFFVGSAMYISIGVAYNYKVRALQGMEMVPHLEFWKDLPYLVKDGAVFLKDKLVSASK